MLDPLSIDKIPAELIGGPCDGMRVTVPVESAHAREPVYEADPNGRVVVYRPSGEPARNGRVTYLYAGPA
jgi:hypothetical protein